MSLAMLPGRHVALIGKARTGGSACHMAARHLQAVLF